MRQDKASKRGRQATIVIVATGVFWILIMLIGEKEGFSQELRLVFDLVAGAGFILAVWLIYQSWRARQDN